MNIFFFLIFLAFWIYALLFAPASGSAFGAANQADQVLDLLLAGKFKDLDLSINIVFFVMGLVPMFLGMFLLPRKNLYKLTIWPFWIGSFFFGAGALLPYLAFRGKAGLAKTTLSSGLENKINKFCTNKFLRIFVLLCIFSFVGLGFWLGSPTAYFKAFGTSQLVNVMSLDFCILMFLVYPYLQVQDLSSKGQ